MGGTGKAAKATASVLDPTHFKFVWKKYFYQQWVGWYHDQKLYSLPDGQRQLVCIYLHAKKGERQKKTTNHFVLGA
jgi:hypothetical protein